MNSGHNRMQAAYKLRGATFCASLRVLFQYRASPRCLLRLLVTRPLWGGFPRCHMSQKMRWTAYLSAIGAPVEREKPKARLRAFCAQTLLRSALQAPEQLMVAQREVEDGESGKASICDHGRVYTCCFEYGAGGLVRADNYRGNRFNWKPSQRLHLEATGFDGDKCAIIFESIFG